MTGDWLIRHSNKIIRSNILVYTNPSSSFGCCSNVLFKLLSTWNDVPIQFVSMRRYASNSCAADPPFAQSKKRIGIHTFVDLYNKMHHNLNIVWLYSFVPLFFCHAIDVFCRRRAVREGVQKSDDQNHHHEEHLKEKKSKSSIVWWDLFELM